MCCSQYLLTLTILLAHLRYMLTLLFYDILLSDFQINTYVNWFHYSYFIIRISSQLCFFLHHVSSPWSSLEYVLQVPLDERWCRRVGCSDLLSPAISQAWTSRNWDCSHPRCRSPHRWRGCWRSYQDDLAMTRQETGQAISWNVHRRRVLLRYAPVLYCRGHEQGLTTGRSPHCMWVCSGR